VSVRLTARGERVLEIVASLAIGLTLAVLLAAAFNIIE
jgi:hypothetical protein